jgi:flagella basal body P-ring formation protein FlgA
MRRTPLFYIFRLRESAFYRAISQASCSLRSCCRIRLGEERVRGLVHGFCIFCVFWLSASYAVGEVPDTAAEEIAAIIRAEIAAMLEWKDADIRVEIVSGVRSLAPGESFRLAPNGLNIGRRNVFAAIEVIRDGKAVRSLSISAVVHINTPAVTAARKIASGEMITERDMRESMIETTAAGAVPLRDPKEIEGKIARRTFTAGDLLTPESFAEPPLVRRGDMVSLRLERGGITLTSSARAEENGRFGEVIRVKSADFSSVVNARVTGRAEVLIQ